MLESYLEVAPIDVAGDRSANERKTIKNIRVKKESREKMPDWVSVADAAPCLQAAA